MIKEGDRVKMILAWDDFYTPVVGTALRVRFHGVYVKFDKEVLDDFEYFDTDCDDFTDECPLHGEDERCWSMPASCLEKKERKPIQLELFP